MLDERRINLLANAILGCAIGHNYKSNLDDLASLLHFKNLVAVESLSFESALAQNYLETECPHLPVCFVGTGTLLFGLEFFANETYILELSQAYDVFGFYLHPGKSHKEYFLEKNGRFLYNTTKEPVHIGSDLLHQNRDRNVFIFGQLNQLLQIDFAQEVKQLEVTLFRTKSAGIFHRLFG